jgi:site-specific DNA-methyltransferase (adenine-specific)
MKPYYEDNKAGITIYHGKCEDILPMLKPASIDLLLTDPPYGIGIAANPFRQKHAVDDWDDKPVDIALLHQYIARARHAIVWGGNYFDLPPHQRFLVWDKIQPEDFSSAMCEQAWTNLQGPAKIFKRHVISYQKWHPSQKPVELMRWCIGFVPDARTIIDPFMGAGTTLRAAKDMGRGCIGVEKNERYCEIAARRLMQEVLPLEAV